MKSKVCFRIQIFFPVASRKCIGSFPICSEPLFPSEAKCEAIDMKMRFYSPAMKLIFKKRFCTQPRYESERFWKLEIAHFKLSLWTAIFVNKTERKILKTKLTSFSRTHYDSDVTTCAFKLESSGDRLLDSVFLDRCSSHVHNVFLLYLQWKYDAARGEIVVPV